jgi:TctA family transporter
MRLYGYPPAPLVLALVLGPMMERATRQALQMLLGSLEIFFSGPVSAVVLLLAGLAVAVPLVDWLLSWGRAAAAVGTPLRWDVQEEVGPRGSGVRHSDHARAEE